MGRFWLGVGLLAAFLALSLGATVFAKDTCAPISDTLEQAAQTAQLGHTEEAVAMAKQARDIWTDRWHGTATFSDHAPMDEIDSLFAQLESYGQAGYTADFSALCTRLSQLIQAVAEAQHLTWWNLL